MIPAFTRPLNPPQGDFRKINTFQVPLLCEASKSRNLFFNRNVSELEKTYKKYLA
jgi:hypothetical protein